MLTRFMVHANNGTLHEFYMFIVHITNFVASLIWLSGIEEQSLLRAMERRSRFYFWQ